MLSVSILRSGSSSHSSCCKCYFSASPLASALIDRSCRLASLRSNAGLIFLFFMLTLTFMFLTIGKYVSNQKITTAGGAFGIITAFIAYYCGAANMYSVESSFFALPLAPIPKPRTA